MKKIQTITVIGAGVMGRQIALNAAVGGFACRVTDSFPDACNKARAWAKEYMEKSVVKGKTTRENADAALSRVSYSENLAEALKGSDLVIEAVIEDEAIKREIFIEASKNAPADAIIASNSSFIPSSVFASIVKRPERLCNLHYFNPAMHMKLVEIVRGAHTSDDTVDALTAFVTAIGKKSIIVNKEIEGFVVNRLVRALINEALFMYQNGIASFEDIDLGAELGLNHPVGPFRLMDFAGIDIGYLSRLRTYNMTGKPEDRPPACLEEKYNKGELGRKTGKGWYDYSEKL